MRNKLYKLFNFLLLLLFVTQAFPQETIVTGTVISAEDNATITGANVVIKGTTTGTITDVDGNFSLTVKKGQTLVASFIGFEKKEVQYNGEPKLTIKLNQKNESLDEFVVIGYGTMKKSDLSGASVSVGEDAIKGSVITNLDQALQGRVAGVTAVMTSGAPGSSTSIRVRGQSTINSGAEPLYVIDGVIVQGGGSSGADFGLGDKLGNGTVSTISPLASLNPSDVESMEILKDASATAIYGAQGSNGVVLITTKRGKAGQAKFSYEGQFAIQQQNKRLDMMNLREFAEYSNSVAAESHYIDSRYEYYDPALLGKGTNWQDAIFKTALLNQHQLSASGGTDAIRYYMSAGYMNQEGTIIGSNFERYSFRTNLDAQLKPWLKLGLNAMYSQTHERLGLTAGNEGIITFSMLTPPDIPIYDMDGNYASVIRENYNRINPIAKALDEELYLDRNKLNGSIYADITPVKNLTWHSELGFDIGGSRGEVFLPQVTYGNWSRGINECSIQRNNNNFYQVKNYLTYNGKADKHNYTVMLGQELWESKWEHQKVFASGLPSNEIHNPALGSDPVISVGYGSSAMASFFGRATYDYDNRYYATYTYRYDGSSNFGPKNRWAGFHSFAASWRFTEEAFLENIKNVINNGKIRFGWGQTGNSDIGGYAWGASISRMPTGLGMGYRQSNIANPYIKWETQEQLNLGIDLAFFNNRINLTADLYDKTSKDMLMPLQLPSYMGTRGNGSSALAAPKGNYGSISNKGLEISLKTQNINSRVFEWSTELQFSKNKNTLLSLDGTANAHIEGYGQWSDVVTVTNVGEPLYNFYGYKVDGVYKDFEDIQNSPKPAKYPSNGVFNRNNTVWVGDLKFADLSGPDGVRDGVIDEYDRTDIGSPQAKFTFGLTNNFRYKNFDLSIYLTGSYGNKIYNYTAMLLSNMKSTWDNELAIVTERARIVPIDGNKTYPTSSGIYNWYDDIENLTVSNPDTKVPRAIANDPNDNDRISDRYVEDGSYLRIKNITLGYTIPANVLNRLKIENVRVYVNIQNLYTFTKYTGFDPEVGVSTLSPNVYGLDNGRYPSPQSFTFGLNLSF